MKDNDENAQVRVLKEMKSHDKPFPALIQLMKCYAIIISITIFMVYATKGLILPGQFDGN